MLNKAIILACVVFFLAVYLLDYYPNYYDEEFMKIILFVNFISLISFWLLKEKIPKLRGQYMKFSVFFLLGFLIVHFQAYVDLALGNLNQHYTWMFSNSNIIIKCALLSSIALNGFLIGYIFSNVKYSDRTFTTLSEKSTSRTKNNNNKKFYSIKPLQFINLLLFVFFLTQVDRAFLDSSQYSNRSIAQGLGFGMLLYETSTIALVTHNIYRHISLDAKVTLASYIKSLSYSFYVLCFYLIIILLSGDRGPIIYLSLAFLFGYIYLTNKKFSITALFLSVFIAGAFLLTLSSIRGESTNTANPIDFITGDQSKAYYPSSFLMPTTELAGSVRTVHLAVANVPKEYDYFNGLFFGQNIILAVPGLSGVLNSMLGIDIKFLTSAKFLTFLDQGLYPTYGVGTSSVADVYLDFGIYGVFLAFTLFGYFTRRFETNIFLRNVQTPITLILYILFFSFSIYIARSNLLVPLVKLPYSLVFFYLLILINKKQ